MIAFANSTRVDQRLRSSSSTCPRLQNDSITALSKESLTEPTDGNSQSRVRAAASARAAIHGVPPSRSC